MNPNPRAPGPHARRGRHLLRLTDLKWRHPQLEVSDDDSAGGGIHACGRPEVATNVWILRSLKESRARWARGASRKCMPTPAANVVSARSSSSTFGRHAELPSRLFAEPRSDSHRTPGHCPCHWWRSRQRPSIRRERCSEFTEERVEHCVLCGLVLLAFGAGWRRVVRNS